MRYDHSYQSPVGLLRITAENDHIIQVVPTEEPVLYPQEVPCIQKAISWLDAYFNGKKPDAAALPLAFCGTPFQIMVWNELLSIPYGSSVTYGQIAHKIAQMRNIQKMSPQAVGQAIGANPIGIIVPCHRVLGVGTKLTGYGWGLEMKRWLLNHEQIPYI